MERKAIQTLFLLAFDSIASWWMQKLPDEVLIA